MNYISHEMRTPLNTVVLGLKLLKDDFIQHGDTQERIEIINDLTTSCEVTLTTLNELLLLDKLESGMIRLESSIINVWQFVINTIKPFKQQVFILYHLFIISIIIYYYIIYLIIFIILGKSIKN